MALPSPPVTPTSRPFFGRTLRSHMKNKPAEKSASPKITGFFNVRKRQSPSCTENQKKRCPMIVPREDLLTPALPYDSNSPLATIDANNFEDSAPSPPKRPRTLTNLGVFDELHSLQRFDFLASIPLSFFCKLALTSQEWSDTIAKYIESNSWKRRFVKSANSWTNSASEDPFEATGKLLKALTIQMSTAERITKMTSFFEDVHLEVENCGHWFRFFNSLCRSWAVHEKLKIARAVKHINNNRLEKLLNVFLTTPRGERPDVEVEIRKLLRGYFFNPLCDKTSTQLQNSEAAFWLSSILRNLEKPEWQAQLLVVLFGHASNGQVDWTSSVDEVVTSGEQAESRFYPIANAISELLKLRQLKESLCNWKDSEIFNLIEEITTMPNPWCFDNFAAFLLQRSRLIPIAVAMRVREGHCEEAGQIVNTLKTLIFRWGLNLNEKLGHPLRYILQALSPTLKKKLTMSVVDAHLAQLREYYLAGEAVAASLAEENSAQTAFLSIIYDAIARSE